ncbi:MAG: MBL fold metallo-hydrolase [Bdellovibrionota bacterium]
MPSDPHVAVLVTGPFQENTYLVADGATRKAILVDPGYNWDELIDYVKQSGFTVDKIVNTHAHLDHAGAVAPICRAFGCPFYLHEGEMGNLLNMPRAGMMFGMPGLEVPEVHHKLHDGMEIPIGELTLKVLETPGHTAGGCSLLVEERHLFVGDTVFRGSVGRTDLPGGNYDTLVRSIQTKILPLSDDTILYPGHGPHTPLGYERKHNPFLVNPDMFRDQMV